MTIKYDVYKSPAEDADEEENYHPRVITSGTVTTEQLAKEIEYGTSMTAGDVKSVFQSFKDLLVHHLLLGKRVHLEEIGCFQLSVKAPAVKDPKKMRADHIQVKSILFLPEQSLKSKVKKAQFERVKVKNHSKARSKEDILQLLKDYFKGYDYINRRDFQILCDLTRTTAQRRINKLIEEGVLRSSGRIGVHVYTLCEAYRD